MLARTAKVLVQEYLVAGSPSLAQEKENISQNTITYITHFLIYIIQLKNLPSSVKDKSVCE